MKVVLLGTGKLAFVLGQNITAGGHTISQVIGRNQVEGGNLSKLLETKFSDFGNINPDADLYIIITSDSAIPETSNKIKTDKGIVVHCSGNTSIEALGSTHTHKGVLYPLDSFPDKEFKSLNQTPVLIEGSDPETCKIISDFADTLSEKVLVLSSEQRKTVHLSAVLSNNFITYLVIKAKEMLKSNDIDASVLNQLLTTTYLNSLRSDYKEFQTGPASRNDSITMEDHYDLLKDDDTLQKIYKLISSDIHQKSK